MTTIEGLGSPTDDLIHPIQEALYKNHGVQCGFCSPGMVRTYIIHSDILEKSYPNKYMQYGFSGVVRGGSGGSADPPKILEHIKKKLEIKHSDPPRSKARQSDPPM